MGVLPLIISMMFFATVSADCSGINVEVGEFPGLDQCGFQDVEEIQPIIYGGNETRRGEFPWLAALEFQKKLENTSVGIHCGGSLINTRYVLTAGHCIFAGDIKVVKVWLGVWKISTADTEDADKVQKFNIEKTIPHPLYNGRRKIYDIALIKLDQNVAYTRFIRPICLPKQDLSLPQAGTNLIVTGWGLTENGTYSDIKLKVAIPFVTNTDCMDALKIELLENQMCAGGEKGKDTCHKDSGGPLMESCTHPETGKVHWFPQGVVSYGLECGIEGRPAVYTRVSKFMDWIKNEVEKN